MRRIGALSAVCACLLLGGGMIARAAPDTPAVAACATNDKVLGLSRMVEVDAAGGPLFGRVNSGGYDFLQDGEVVLTFDDGPLRPNTRAVLKALDEHCTKATFFMVGRMAVADPEMVREVASRGHTVGAHTWSHAKLQGLAPDKAKDEIELGFSAVAQALHGQPGAVLPLPLSAAHRCGDGLSEDAQRRQLHHRRRLARFPHPRPRRREADRAGAAGRRRKGILLFHDIQPSTAHALSRRCSTS